MSTKASNESNMYILTKLDVIDLSNKIEFVTYKSILAIQYLHIQLELLKAESNDKTYDIIHGDLNKIEIYSRNKGYLYSNKTLVAIYEILEYGTKLEKL